jgi:hypothetical protein
MKIKSASKFKEQTMNNEVKKKKIKKIGSRIINILRFEHNKKIPEVLKKKKEKSFFCIFAHYCPVEGKMEKKFLRAIKHCCILQQ